MLQSFPSLISLPHSDSAQVLHPLAHSTFITFLLQDEKGAFNFDQETVINPETGEQVREPPWSQAAGTGDTGRP